MSGNNKRSSATLLTAGAVIVATAIAWVAFRPSAKPPGAVAEPNAPAAEEQAAPATNAQAAADDTDLRAQSPTERSNAPRLPVVIQPIARPVLQTAAPAPGIARVEPSPYFRQLVSGL